MTGIKNTLQDNVHRNVATVEVLGLMKVVSATVLPSKNNVETGELSHFASICRSVPQSNPTASQHKQSKQQPRTYIISEIDMSKISRHHMKKVRVMLHLPMQRMLTQTSFHILMFSFEEKNPMFLPIQEPQ